MATLAMPVAHHHLARATQWVRPLSGRRSMTAIIISSSSRPCPRCGFASASSAAASPRIIRRPIKLTLARPSSSSALPTRASLIATSPPPSLPPPRSSRPPAPVQLRPAHFLKQFFLLIHPDLFHTSHATVHTHHTLLSSSPSTSPCPSSSPSSPPPPTPLTIVTPGLDSTSTRTLPTSTIRRTNEHHMAQLNELMSYHKTLLTYGPHVPIVAAMPRPPHVGLFHFYARQAGGEGKEEECREVREECTLPSSHTPVVLTQAIDAFLARLLVSAGVPIPASLCREWEEEREARSAPHRYSRMRQSMPWMFDRSQQESERRQLEMARRDFTQQRLHMHRMGVRERGEYYMRWMYQRGLIRFAAELSEEERMRAMAFLSSLLTEFATQLQVEDWLGSEVRVGLEEDGYAWQLGVLQLPWDMSQKEVWRTTRRYVCALRKAREELEGKEEGSQVEGKEAAERQGPATVPVAELSDEQVEHLLGSYDDSDWIAEHTSEAAQAETDGTRQEEQSAKGGPRTRSEGKSAWREAASMHSTSQPLSSSEPRQATSEATHGLHYGQKSPGTQVGH